MSRIEKLKAEIEERAQEYSEEKNHYDKKTARLCYTIGCWQAQTDMEISKNERLEERLATLSAKLDHCEAMLEQTDGPEWEEYYDAHYVRNSDA